MFSDDFGVLVLFHWQSIQKMKSQMTRNLLLLFKVPKEAGCIRSFHNLFILSSERCNLFRSGGLMKNVSTNVYTRQQICTAHQLLDLKTEKPLCLSKGDEGYFDFKELECNASAERRIDHFMALMCEIFQLSEEEAEEIVKYYPFLWKEFLHKTFTHVKSLGLEKATFMQYPWLISMPPEDIDIKLQIISKAFPDLGNVNLCAMLFKYPNKKIEMLTYHWKNEAVEFEHPSKFHFLAHTLKVPIGEILNQLESKSFLLSFPYSRIREGVNICLQAGVQKDDLMRDLWVLRNRPIKLRNRIETLLQSKIPVKPWVLRARLKSFETHIQEYWQEKKDTEYDDNLSSYLRQRLECEHQTVERMLQVFPSLKKATIRRVKPNLDYLLIEKRISPNIIIMTPRILCQKFGTVKDRMEKLEAAGIQYTSLWMVCRGQREFDEFVRRWNPSKLM